jgi:predicted transcriptional regulator
MSHPAMDAPYSRLFAYFVAEFIQRTALPVVAAFDNDYEQAMIFLVITTQNTQNLMLNQLTRRQYASFGALVPEHLLRPVSRMALARSTNLPRETVRRKVLKLMERGFVEETSKGLIVPRSVRDIPLYAETVSVQEANLRRLFSMVGEAMSADPTVAAALWGAMTSVA